jgi:hypothetical protein
MLLEVYPGVSALNSPLLHFWMIRERDPLRDRRGTAPINNVVQSI